MAAAPDIFNSNAEERRNYIKKDFHVLQTVICAGSALYFTAKMRKSPMKHIFVESVLLRMFPKITDEAMSGKDGTNEYRNKSFNSRIRRSIL